MDANPSRRRTAAPGAAARPATNEGQAAPPPAGPTYTSLPAHLRTWPRALPTTNEPGFADEAAWLKEVGSKVSVQTRQALRDGVDDGSIPAVRLGDLKSELVTLSGQAGQRLVLARDPRAAQVDPGPLRAQVFARVGEDVISVPTRATARLMGSEEERTAAAQLAIKEALPQLGGPAPTSLRLAWLAQAADEPPRVRVVEYRDPSGKALMPGPREDLEARVARIDRTKAYTLDDLRRDTAAKVLSGARAAVPAAQQAPAAIPSPEGQTAAPASSSAPTSTAARTAAPAAPNAPVRPEGLGLDAGGTPAGGEQARAPRAAAPGPEIEAGRPAAAPARPVATRSPSSAFASLPRSAPNAYLFEASQRINCSAAPTAETAHAFVVVASAEKLMGTAKDGVVDLHAGIASNYMQFLHAGEASGRGQMGEGSKLILAERKGDALVIRGYMPYAGVRAGTPPAARLLARADQAVAFEKPLELSLAQLGMPVPNLPFAVARESTTSGFGITPEVRRNLWNATHRLAGWPTE